VDLNDPARAPDTVADAGGKLMSITLGFMERLTIIS
jgi:hypothetical protein